MSLEIGIVGLPNVGKSTLFNALTGATILAANYPFATIEPNVGVVPLPDPRLGVLGRLFESARVVPATVTFVDIAGLVRGASQGEGLGNRFLANIREVSAVCHVVRAFSSPDVAHVAESADPEGDIETVETELALADLQTLDKRLPRLEKEAAVDRSLGRVVATLEAARAVVASGGMISGSPQLAADVASNSDLRLLTAKPIIYVFNCDEATLGDTGRREELAEMVAPARSVFLDAQLEADLVGLDHEERSELLESVGQTEPGLFTLARAAYGTLGLQSFLTVGPKEARAWTIPGGATALEAAALIHTDFARGFIAAEVISYDQLIGAGSWSEARRSGLVRTEGRAYRMQPGDVVEFRFNV